ncbi:MAG: class III extradiol dioxygenase subunit B-like domain-containing protein [Cyanobacteriota bacterium]
MALEQVVLLPHPPIVLPEVAGSRFNDVKTTAEGMIEISKDIVFKNPETIIIITPHSMMHRNSFATYSDDIISGNFSMFGAPNVTIKVKNNLDLIANIKKNRESQGKNDIVFMPPKNKLDHGSGVPLYYLLKAGYKGSVVIFNYCVSSKDVHIDFGKTLLDTVKNSNIKTILVASGDLSHRIIPSAPAGFHPDGEKFDQLIVNAIKDGNYNLISSMDNALRDNAGECAYNSLMVAFGAINEDNKQSKIYSYEAPFGVGYLVASL